MRIEACDICGGKPYITDRKITLCRFHYVIYDRMAVERKPEDYEPQESLSRLGIEALEPDKDFPLGCLLLFAFALAMALAALALAIGY